MRNFTQRLLTARKAGQAVVCSFQPYEGWPVAYAPRNPKDPQPWKLLRQDGSDWPGSIRLHARECRAVEALT